jgi:hypothetical protein
MHKNDPKATLTGRLLVLVICSVQVLHKLGASHGMMAAQADGIGLSSPGQDKIPQAVRKARICEKVDCLRAG